jgi:hypothetical protein
MANVSVLFLPIGELDVMWLDATTSKGNRIALDWVEIDT